MIRRKVSAVLLVRDGFTGQPAASGSALVCRLDDRPVRPLYKPGGYLVLTDLEPGQHTFTLSAGGFQTEVIPLSISGNAVLELETALRPGQGYVFPRDTARLRLALSDETGVLAGETVWIGWPALVQLRLAQDIKEADVSAGDGGQPEAGVPAGNSGHSGTSQQPVPLRLFCSGAESLLPVPGHFLLLDDKQPERVHLRFLRDGNGELDAPPRCVHPRGTRLVPAAPFQTDGEGRTAAAFPMGGTVSLFCREKRRDVELGPGTAEIAWNLSEGGQGGQ